MMKFNVYYNYKGITFSLVILFKIIGLKQFHWVSRFGLLIVLAGELLRKLAMYTAGHNFNHYVQHVREDGHTLITSGVYSLSRHPSYVGWFYWSVGTQVCKPMLWMTYPNGAVVLLNDTQEITMS